MKQVALAAAVICFIIAVLYFTGIILGFHVKHGLVFLGLGVLALLWMRFASARQPGVR